MNLEEAFILTCHTGYITDNSFVTDKNPSQEFLDKCAQLLKRDVYLEEFLIESEKLVEELKKASYEPWMKIVNEEKE